MTNTEFEREYYPKYRHVVKAIARKLARDDDTLLEDLMQEGFLCMLEIDLTTARKNPDSWLRQAIRFSMIDHMRAMDPNKYASLDTLLAQHFQVALDDGDNVVVVRDPSWRQRREWERNERYCVKGEDSLDPLDG